VAELLVIVPSKGRPQSVARVYEAWVKTGAFEHAKLVFAVDADDSKHSAYFDADLLRGLPQPGNATVYFQTFATWQPMVPKLNECARIACLADDRFEMVAFMGDDHVPRSHGWAARYVEALRDLGTGIVYGDDLVQGEKLPTQWAMTSDIVSALGRMVPAPVEHLYCDNAVLDLGRAADCIRYLPDVVIEHCHPVAQRGAWDAGYERVNSRTQYAADRARYLTWRRDQMAADAETVRALRSATLPS
jgi:hypothetical protein